jgi:hypothetical protein
MRQRKPTVRPALSAAHAAALARRYAAGEPLARLVKEYRTWTAIGKQALRRAGLDLRPEDTAPNLCRICGAPVPSCTQRRLCAAHVRSFCSQCEAPLPAGRGNPWCTACESAKKARLWARPGRQCTVCEEPVTGHASQCAACLAAAYELERSLKLRQERTCVQCAVPLPRGRRVPRCARCWKRKERRRRRERLARGEHRCVQCGETLPLSRCSYCAGCDIMQANWRRAYHQGCPVARRLGTLEQRRQWQVAA